jgi:hypothetical protein
MNVASCQLTRYYRLPCFGGEKPGCTMIQSYPGWFTNLCLLFWWGNRFTDNCQYFLSTRTPVSAPGNNTSDADRSGGCFAIETKCVHSRFGCMSQVLRICVRLFLTTVACVQKMRYTLFTTCTVVVHYVCTRQSLPCIFLFIDY